MQSLVDGRDRSVSRICNRLMMSDRTHINENVANNSQPADSNTRVIVDEGNCAPLQIQMTVGNGQSRPGKRPIKNVSPADKLGAINRVHDGESKASVARDIGIPESTLRGWCKSEHKIRSQCNNVSNEMITRHCSISIGNGRSMSANDRQSVSSWDSGSNRQSPDTPSSDDAPVAKRMKIEQANQQNNSQAIMPGPSTSSVDMDHGINPNYAALIASSMANSIATMSLHEQHQMYALLTTLKEVMLQRNNSIALMENGLHCTKTNNTTFPATVSSSSTAINNIRGIDSVHSTMANMIGNAMGDTLNYTIGKKNIAVAPVQDTTSSSTRKSPSVIPAAEAPTTPTPASPHENNAHPRATDNIIDEDVNISGDAPWLWFVQKVLNTQQFSGHNLEDVSNMLNSRKDWCWPYAKWDKSPTKSQCSAENALTYLDLLFNNNNFGNPVSDDSSENRTHSSHSVTSERSDSHEERNDSLITVATAESADTPTTPPVNKPTFSAEMMETLRVTKVDPSNAGIEQAIEYSTWLQKWLDNCSIPLLTAKQVLEHKYIVDVLKWFKNLQSMTQEKVVPESCIVSAEPHDEGRQL